jgi:hypothetical protein
VEGFSRLPTDRKLHGIAVRLTGDYPDPNSFLDIWVTGVETIAHSGRTLSTTVSFGRRDGQRIKRARFELFQQAEAILMEELRSFRSISTPGFPRFVLPSRAGFPNILDNHPYKHVLG